MAYPEGLLTSGERVREHVRPHVRMLVVPAIVPPLVVGVGCWLAALVTRLSWHGAAWTGLAVIGVVLVGRFSVTPLLRWWCTHLVITDRRLLVREGVLSRSGVDVAGWSITGVRTRQRGTERLLGCGTLVVGTRDAPDDPWEFHGIPHLAHTAARLGTVAEERGALLGRLDDQADLDDELDDDFDDDFDDELDGDEILEAELVDDDPVEGWGPVSSVSRDRRPAPPARPARPAPPARPARPRSAGRTSR